MTNLHGLHPPGTGIDHEQRAAWSPMASSPGTGVSSLTAPPAQPPGAGALTLALTMYAKRPGHQPRLSGRLSTPRAVPCYVLLARRRRPNSQYATEPVVFSALATRQRFLGPRT